MLTIKTCYYKIEIEDIVGQYSIVQKEFEMVCSDIFSIIR